ncbi:MAG: glycosyltransferase [Patescibacteria group bacterium]|nr:glycosyltransferase [Patescibacteria group bacterium]MCL5431591.1 glycosyltransferase [Patescibacteria group bacterium]
MKNNLIGKGHKPTKNQSTFNKAISLQSHLKNSNFPKIRNFIINDPDSIRFEPFLNRDLLRLNLESLQKIKPNETKVIKQVKEEIGRIDKIVNKTPDIMTKNLRPLSRSLSKSPKVSIITTSMNLAPLLDETMRSIFNQEGDDYEYIVIDGGSSDNSLKLMKKYPISVLISEKDSGYPEAFWKGLRLAKGKYIMQCCISDGYASPSWVKKCVQFLDSHKDISLVWGNASGLSAKGQMVDITYPRFVYEEAPQGEQMFSYWLKTAFHYPEVNLCVRKEVILKCYPPMPWRNEDMLDWLEFDYRFNKSGYLSKYLPILASFHYLEHGNKLGKKLDKNGWYQRVLKIHKRRIWFYKWQLLLGFATHRFVNSKEEELSTKFDHNKLRQETLSEIKSHLLQ